MLPGVNLEYLKKRISQKVIVYESTFRNGSPEQALIQDSVTGAYLGNGGLWTMDREIAIGFRSGLTALQRARKLNLKNLQLVLTHGSEICEVIPVMNGDSD